MEEEEKRRECIKLDSVSEAWGTWSDFRASMRAGQRYGRDAVRVRESMKGKTIRSVHSVALKGKGLKAMRG
jgi:hypothetical protein